VRSSGYARIEAGRAGLLHRVVSLTRGGGPLSACVSGWPDSIVERRAAGREPWLYKSIKSNTN
jgi:hypothetical protein